MIILTKAPFTQRWHPTAPHSRSYFFSIKFVLFSLQCFQFQTFWRKNQKKNSIFPLKNSLPPAQQPFYWDLSSLVFDTRWYLKNYFANTFDGGKKKKEKQISIGWWFMKILPRLENCRWSKSWSFTTTSATSAASAVTVAVTLPQQIPFHP